MSKLIQNSFVKRALAICAVASGLMTGTVAMAADWANVLMYHRFGEDRYPSTNIKLEQFEAHLQELKTGGYTVLPLGKIVDALTTGEELPDRTVAITIDDGYKSVYTEAWPRLKAAGFPFTLFVSTNQLGDGNNDYMSWADLKEMVASGNMYVGHHGAGHVHMPALSLEKVRADLLKANEAFQTNLGFVPGIFAYPYGEYGLDIKNLIEDMGFKAAFGQHSGVSYSSLDRFELPRFTMNETYGNIGRLRLAANALPLRVRNVVPKDKILKRNPPNFGFTLDEEYDNLNQLNCYASSGTVPINRVGVNRIEVRLRKPYRPGRGRINCTLPGPDQRFRWFGTLFYIPRN
ncbi:polysaccharide deacetylase family protein [Sneathiella sp. P13V-1]|uniref:polysaccharide deacetylase family protein n=1 Tax=Sneathiella sp. P13V-1 TaxID=2697366 RepID=UPI00187BB66D|nr:polysaccharide deacetylase family protein [Sneathiella sp. P13V-1]MBE7635846.1 polysaccharide deacetylase family protein [Sneathiella sp. P13V-1]